MSSETLGGDGHQGEASYRDGDPRLIRLAQNQALFRDVNERVAKVAVEYVTHGPLSFVCECSSTECGAQVELTQAEYERVRSVPSWFLVRPGHEIADMEDVVESNHRFAIVAKLAAAKAVALASDPRRGAARDV